MQSLVVCHKLLGVRVEDEEARARRPLVDGTHQVLVRRRHLSGLICERSWNVCDL